MAIFTWQPLLKSKGRLGFLGDHLRFVPYLKPFPYILQGPSFWGPPSDLKVLSLSFQCQELLIPVSRRRRKQAEMCGDVGRVFFWGEPKGDVLFLSGNHPNKGINH